MKKVVLFIVFCLIAVPAMAEKYEDPIGAGIDVVIAENPVEYVDKVVAEYKYDFNNEENSLFLVATVDGRSILKKLKELGCNNCC